MNRHPVRHERFSTGELSLHVVRAGGGESPVILLHGFPERWSTWLNQIDPLVDAGFDVWMPDLRGYGDSDRPRERSAYALPRLVADVTAMVTGSGAERASIVGHDWGGVVAWAFARTHPELLDRLIILNAPHPSVFAREIRRPRQAIRSAYIAFFQLPGVPEALLSFGNFRLVRRMFEGARGDRGQVSERQIGSYLEGLRQPGALRAALDYYRANRRGARGGLSRGPLARPTLVLWGERDPALGTGLLEGLDRFVSQLTIERFPDVGHWVQNEVPVEVNAKMIAFLTA
jgi:epoxide hydrolase 4